MNYEWQCPDCKKSFLGSTTGTYTYDDAIECPFCGRISTIYDITHIFHLEATERKVSPTELQKLEALKKEQK